MTAHERIWRLAESLSVSRCHYCRRPFTTDHPPTRDHVVPVANGGTLADGYVLACSLCNRARASAPYETYARFVRWEHILSFLEDRPYRRPTVRSRGAGCVLTTLPRSAWTQVRELMTGIVVTINGRTLA